MDTQIIPQTKTCTKCGIEYPATPEFFRFRNGRLTFPCKKCNQSAHKAWLRNNGVNPAHRVNRTDTHGQCTKCGEWKPLSPEFFRFHNGRYEGSCRECSNAHKEQYRRERGIKPSNRGFIVDGYMRCTCCGVNKPATSEYFTTNRATKAGIVGKCKECRKAYLREFRKKPDRIQVEKAYRQRPDVKLKKKTYYTSDHGKEVARQYKKTPKAVAYRKSREHNESQRAYATSERGKLRACVTAGNRRARMLGLPDTFTAPDWEQALNYFGQCCAVCGRPPGFWHKLAQDHWIPITSPICPGTIPSNIVPLCHGIDGCNNLKSNKDAKTWLIDRFGKRKGQAIMKRIQAYFDWLKNG